jgi:OTU domain-containing protein 3
MDADIEVDGDNGDGGGDVDADADADADDADTPSLSETASLSPVSSPSPSPSPPPVSTPSRRLTKRERKAAGLPRQRGSAGKIVIPGGRFRTDDATVRGVGSRVDADGEWARNGTGRVDVRGFRELRI